MILTGTCPAALKPAGPMPGRKSHRTAGQKCTGEWSRGGVLAGPPEADPASLSLARAAREETDALPVIRVHEEELDVLPMADRRPAALSVVEGKPALFLSARMPRGTLDAHPTMSTPEVLQDALPAGGAM